MLMLQQGFCQSLLKSFVKLKNYLKNGLLKLWSLGIKYKIVGPPSLFALMYTTGEAVYKSYIICPQRLSKGRFY